MPVTAIGPPGPVKLTTRSAVKLAGGAAGTLHTLVLNGVECEPYITSDDVLMRERATEIVHTVKSHYPKLRILARARSMQESGSG